MNGFGKIIDRVGDELVATFGKQAWIVHFPKAFQQFDA